MTTLLKKLPNKYGELAEFLNRTLENYTSDTRYEADDRNVTVQLWDDTWVEFKLNGATDEWEMLDGHPDVGRYEPQYYVLRIGQTERRVEQWEAMFWRNAYFNKRS